jgi:membrane protease subunit HflK
MTLNHSSEMLTADENIVDVSISVWYRIKDPRKFLFAVASPILSVQEASASALRQVIGGTSLDQILTTGRNKVMEDTKRNLISILAPYNTGIEIREVNLLPAKPPEQVTAAFDDAIKAREDEQKYINQARAYAEKVEPRAEGIAARLERQAKADATKIVLKAKADIAPYNALVSAYKKEPALTTYRIYYNLLGGILNKVNKIVAEDPSAMKLILATGNSKVVPEALTPILDEDTNDSKGDAKSVQYQDNNPKRRLDYSMIDTFTRGDGYEK